MNFATGKSSSTSTICMVIGSLRDSHRDWLRNSFADWHDGDSASAEGEVSFAVGLKNVKRSESIYTIAIQGETRLENVCGNYKRARVEFFFVFRPQISFWGWSILIW